MGCCGDELAAERCFHSEHFTPAGRARFEHSPLLQSKMRIARVRRLQLRSSLRDVFDLVTLTGGRIDDERLADNALRKSVFGEAMDLLVQALAEVFGDASLAETV